MDGRVWLGNDGPGGRRLALIGYLQFVVSSCTGLFPALHPTSGSGFRSYFGAGQSQRRRSRNLALVAFLSFLGLEYIDPATGVPMPNSAGLAVPLGFELSHSALSATPRRGEQRRPCSVS